MPPQKGFASAGDVPGRFRHVLFVVPIDDRRRGWVSLCLRLRAYGAMCGRLHRDRMRDMCLLDRVDSQPRTPPGKTLDLLVLVTPEAGYAHIDLHGEVVGRHIRCDWEHRAGLP